MSKKIRLLLFMGLLTLHLTSLANGWTGEPKLYISTSREIYGPGETVRFQAILLAASSNPRHSMFAELYDCKGNRLSKKVFPVIDQLAAGSVDIPRNRKDDFYLLYCYTLDSAAHTEYDFIKRINTVATQQSSAIPASWSVNDISLEVFPEGNNFVSSLNNTLLVKIFYKKDQPLSVTARMINEKDEVVGIFQTNEQGFAKIQFRPEEKGSYFIAVEDKAGNEKQAHLPKPSAVGINLNAVYKDSVLYIKWSSYTSNANQPLDYRIEISRYGQDVYDAAVSFKQGVSEVLQEVNANDLPEGYLLVRLLENGAKRIERILYNMHNNQAGYVIKIIDTLQHKEATVQLPPYINGKSYVQITGVDMQQSTATAGLNNYGRSVMVPVLEPASKTDINDLLIAIKQLPYTFADTFPAAKEYLSVSGTLHNKEGKLLKNKAVNIIVVQKNLRKQFYLAQTNEAGKLNLGGLIFFDTANVYYQLADKSEDKNNIVLEPDAEPVSLTHLNPGGINFPCSPGYKIEATKVEDKTLEQVIVKGQTEKTNSEKFEDKYTSAQISKKTGVRNEFDFIKNPQVIDHTSLFDFIQTRFAGLIVKTLATGNGNPTITTSYFAPVDVYLDGNEISQTDMGVLADLEIKDVALVKYQPMSSKTKNGGGNPFLDPKAQDGGDLIIYTKKDFIASDAAVQGMPRVRLAGYDIEWKPRDPLYWNPNYILQKDLVIYIGLPPTAPATCLKLEGINNAFAPFSFSKELIFR